MQPAQLGMAELEAGNGFEMLLDQRRMVGQRHDERRFAQRRPRGLRLTSAERVSRSDAASGPALAPSRCPFAAARPPGPRPSAGRRARPEQGLDAARASPGGNDSAGFRRGCGRSAPAAALSSARFSGVSKTPPSVSRIHNSSDQRPRIGEHGAESVRPLGLDQSSGSLPSGSSAKRERAAGLRSAATPGRRRAMPPSARPCRRRSTASAPAPCATTAPAGFR